MPDDKTPPPSKDQNPSEDQPPKNPLDDVEEPKNRKVHTEVFDLLKKKRLI